MAARMTVTTAVSVESQGRSSDLDDGSAALPLKDVSTFGSVPAALVAMESGGRTADPASAPLLQTSYSSQNFKLSDAVSVLSGEEIAQRREALKLFSSQLSMASIAQKSVSPQPPAVVVSYDMTPFSSTVSSLCPFCRICQCPADGGNPLISPCRCSGSLKFIHGSCLRKWLEVVESKHKHTGPAFCELCGYIYRRHKFLKRGDWKWPQVAVRDKVLHSVFAVSFCLMLACAVATVMCFTTDEEELHANKQIDRLNDGKLNSEEMITISCGVTFFVSFFVAMFVEMKAKHAIHYIIRRLIRHNTIWVIENYNPAHDRQQTLRSSR